MQGRIIPLSPPRRLIGDLVHFAKKVPTVPVQRRINVAAVRQARERLTKKVSWCVLFTKAYGIVCRRFPELRRSYLGFPWPRLYEHPHSIASVAVERQYLGENAVFFGHLRRPEDKPLPKLETYLRRYKEAPLDSIGMFRGALLVGRLIRPLRRLLWWIGLNSTGRMRAHWMGTFGVTVYSGLGAESLHPLSPATTSLNYGPIDADGNVNVRLIYDHRVMDGATVARALAEIDKVMNTEIVQELQELRYRTGQAA